MIIMVLCLLFGHDFINTGKFTKYTNMIHEEKQCTRCKCITWEWDYLKPGDRLDK